MSLFDYFSRLSPGTKYKCVRGWRAPWFLGERYDDIIKIIEIRVADQTFDVDNMTSEQKYVDRGCREDQLENIYKSHVCEKHFEMLPAS